MAYIGTRSMIEASSSAESRLACATRAAIRPARWVVCKSAPRLELESRTEHASSIAVAMACTPRLASRSANLRRASSKLNLPMSSTHSPATSAATRSARFLRIGATSASTYAPQIASMVCFRSRICAASSATPSWTSASATSPRIASSSSWLAISRTALSMRSGSTSAAPNTTRRSVLLVVNINGLVEIGATETECAENSTRSPNATVSERSVSVLTQWAHNFKAPR